MAIQQNINQIISTIGEGVRGLKLKQISKGVEGLQQDEVSKIAEAQKQASIAQSKQNQETIREIKEKAGLVSPIEKNIPEKGAWYDPEYDKYIPQEQQEFIGKGMLETYKILAERANNAQKQEMKKAMVFGEKVPKPKSEGGYYEG